MELFKRLAQIVVDLLQVGMVMNLVIGFPVVIKTKKIGFFIAIVVGLTVCTEIWYNEDLYYCTGLILCTISSYMFFQKNGHNRFISCVITYIIISGISSLLYAMSVSAGMENIFFIYLEPVIYVISTVVVAILAFAYNRGFKKEINTHTHKGVMIIVCCTLLCGATAAIIPLFDNSGEITNDKFNIVFSLMCFFVMLVCVVLMYFVSQNDDYKLNEELNNEKARLLNEYYNDVRKNSEEIKRFRHDYKNHIRSIKYLLDSNEYDRLKRYIADIEESTFIQEKPLDVGNKFVSAIFSDYKTKSEADNISMSIKGSIPEDTNVSEMDWCTIFSNCLQNAVEATRNITTEKRKKIDINLTNIDNKLVIKIDNPLEEIPVLIDGEMRTSKKDKSSHGFGIKNVKRSVEKYHGNLSYNINEDEKIISTNIIMVVKDCSAKKKDCLLIWELLRQLGRIIVLLRVRMQSSRSVRKRRKRRLEKHWSILG